MSRCKPAIKLKARSGSKVNRNKSSVKVCKPMPAPSQGIFDDSFDDTFG
jgi:hypothetical protein